MSFVNLMADDRWSEADIVNRTEAMIAEHFPPVAAEILRRKIMGQMLGAYSLTADEQADVAAYQALAMQAGAAADAARADMATLEAVLAVEAAQRRLALDPLPDDERDAGERAAAQAVIGSAPGALDELIAARALARSAQ